MEKYKLIGVTEYAERHLNNPDLQSLKLMIGCEIEESDNTAEIDGGKLFIMPDGTETHECFLQVELLTPPTV